MSTIIDTLVTNRVGGYYNATDLNRVETAAAYLMAQFDALPAGLLAYLASLGVAPDTIFEVPYSYPLGLVTKTDWVPEDSSAAELTRFIDNIKALRDVITLPSGTPELPGDMNSLNVTEANNIEAVLQAIDVATLTLEALKKTYADYAAKSFVYSGEIGCGET